MVVIGGWLHRWTNEDAYINLRVVEQIVAGHGPVFNQGQRVEAFTSPLWLAVLVVIRVTVGQVVAIEWAMVAVSLAMAAGGFWLAARVTRRLHPDGSVVVPVGLGAVAAAPVLWDFATSGLEMPLVWLWLAGSWAVLVSAAQRDDTAHGWPRVGAVVVLGLGPLIRPDLGLMSLCLVGAWLWITRPARLAALADVAIAFAPTFAYQVFRMGYYASLVPTSALAKDAGGLHVAQGWRYALDLSRPYALWIPLVLVVALIARTMARHGRDVRVATGGMVAAALVHAAYLVVVGGDYMHGRLLLPALFAVVLAASASFAPRMALGEAVLAGAVVAVTVGWAVRCAGWARYENTPTFVLPPIASWREIAPRPLVQPRENQTAFWSGSDIADAYSQGQRGTVQLLGDRVLPAGDPHKLVVVLASIGLAGYDSGIDVRVVDIQGLGEPLVARAEAIPGRPAGHRKQVNLEWYTAQFGVPAPNQSDAKVAAARRALRCPPLSDLLAAIDEPLTPGRFMSNLVHSPGYTRLHIPADPRTAMGQFCGP